MQVSINGYSLLPAYRGVLDLAAQAGASADADLASRIALFGGPDEIRAGLERYRRAGCVPVPSPMPGTDDDFARTVEALYGR
jgi:alkanesulfonate monooxygenase SsuD/methylene tetrahydromethanopterin reductase-like flavin-dependent oxidoreductase (luciferase family)